MTPKIVTAETRKHTPAPWTTEVLGSTLRVVSDFDFQPGVMCGNDVAVLGDCKDSRVQADAHLITAAPDLLSALLGMVGLVQLIQAREPELQNNHRFVDALAAIAKAEGRS